MLPALPSYSFVSHRHHPSRLPFGPQRAALTGPGGDAEHLPDTREWQAEFWHHTSRSARRAQVRVTGSGCTARRILQCSVRSGPWTQFAFSVRGSSRRIMTMRFRPADIRVINRRICPRSCHPLCAFPGRASPTLLTRSPHIRKRTVTRLAPGTGCRVGSSRGRTCRHPCAGA
jgi:hypothetical protein